ncbi:MAG: hypothetical protein DPW14_03770 [Planctomycetes bacterium]|nr:hypothetical protein [Planctomycetota bacterium]
MGGYCDWGVLVDERSGRGTAIGWRETFMLEVRTEHHGVQRMMLGVLELHTLWRLVGRAMKWRRERRQGQSLQDGNPRRETPKGLGCGRGAL